MPAWQFGPQRMRSCWLSWLEKNQAQTYPGDVFFQNWNQCQPYSPKHFDTFWHLLPFRWFEDLGLFFLRPEPFSPPKKKDGNEFRDVLGTFRFGIDSSSQKLPGLGLKVPMELALSVVAAWCRWIPSPHSSSSSDGKTDSFCVLWILFLDDKLMINW